MNTTDAALGAWAILIVAFLVTLGVLWLVLPFAIFGTKNLIREQTEEIIGLRRDMRELIALIGKGGKTELSELRLIRSSLARPPDKAPAPAIFDADGGN